MAGRVEIIKSVVINTGKKMYREKTINAGTKALFDMSLPGFGGAEDVDAGAEIKSLTYNDLVATFNKAHVYSNGGMIYPRVANDGFDMPSEACPRTDDKHWLFTAWLKITNPGGSGFNNHTMHFATTGFNTASATMLSIIPTVRVADGVTSVTTIEVRTRAKNNVVTTQLQSLFDGNVHQIGVELEISDDKTQQRTFIYLDGTQVYASGYVAVPGTAPGDPTTRRIGTSSSLPITWGGSFYRARFDDLTLTSLTAAEIIAADYESKKRFS
nr:hypothetical protein [Pantoea sp. 201603H]